MRKKRMPDTVKGFQEYVRKSLSNIFGEDNVIKEWNVAKDSRDLFTRELYSPRLDIAVGPFNIYKNIEKSKTEIKRVASSKRNFIKTIFKYSELRTGTSNQLLDSRNKNPRCFLAIEIENSGSSKHMLGNIANVSILGFIGIVIPFNDKKLSLCKRIRKYVNFATSVKKLEDVFKNVLIISKENFFTILESSSY